MAVQGNDLAGVAAAATETELEHGTTDAEQLPETDTEGEEDNSRENGNDSDSAKEERKQNHQQRRWERLLREKYAATARAEYLEKMLAMQQSQRNEGTAANDAPAPDQYRSQEEYVQALVKWELSQRDKVAEERDRAREEQAQMARREKLFAEAEELGDFDREDFFQNVKVSPLMAEAILESDLGAKIVVHLNAHADEAARIANLPPARQAAEIGKLEAKLASPPPKKSAAPKPIQPLQGKATTSDLNDDLSPDEWMRRRNAQIFGKR
jgi:hypothetical protein